ncbi:hypothetical protein Clacol_001210 [Clathrus columnatus]|uniref:Uncharacterized protein n=1 Tax=Clathrus columnatus TaxID=1419009 RepID=A0AAV5A0D5_9AGAM|nr:hypothetical protein Clacol_001210 [Clathrus columnatus]
MATLANKIILIIGGSSGIGFGVAEASLKSFAKTVIIASSNKERVEKAVKRLTGAKLGGGEIIGRVVNAGNEESIKGLLDDVGEVDHIIFTSGRLETTLAFPGWILIKLKTTTVEISFLFKDSLDLRLWGVVAVAKHAKIRSGGSLTLTSGTLAIKPAPTLSVAIAGAGALHTLTSGLAVDLAPIRVNIICSGAKEKLLKQFSAFKVDTELWDDLPPSYKESFLKDTTKKLLVGHLGQPDEVRF